MTVPLNKTTKVIRTNSYELLPENPATAIIAARISRISAGEVGEEFGLPDGLKHALYGDTRFVIPLNKAILEPERPKTASQDDYRLQKFLQTLQSKNLSYSPNSLNSRLSMYVNQV